MNLPRVVATTALACELSRSPLGAGDMQGGPYTLTGSPVATITTATGETYALDGAAGAPASIGMSGGPFTLDSGILGLRVVPGDVTVVIEWTAEQEVRLVWPAVAGPYLLETTETLGDPDGWRPAMPAPADNSFIAPADAPTRFFRLRKL